MKRPNFLFIMTDQLRPDHTGFGGNGMVQTPHLDRLAARSRQFARAYCPTPMCGPSRSAIMTGRMPSANGSWTNAISLEQEANTFVRVLRQNGYQTGLIGKAHLQDFVKRTAVKGNMLNVAQSDLMRYPPQGEGRAVERPLPDGWDKHEQHWFHEQGYAPMPDDYYGFAHVELALSHDDRAEGHHYYWVKEQGGDPDAFGGRANALAQFPGWQQIWRSNTPPEFYTTSFVTERSIAYLQEAAQQDEPFFLVASYPDPHHPFGLPDPYYSMYDPAQIPLPESFYDPQTKGMPHFKRLIAERGKDAVGPFLFSCDEAQFRMATAVEYGAITFLDEAIGKLLQKLAELHLADDTIILFCSDHGDMFGDHGLMLKVGTHYQGATQVPLLIAGGGIVPGKTDSLAGLLDVGRTVLDLADCQPYRGMQGCSLRPILGDETAVVRDSVLIEEGYQADFLHVGCDLAMRTVVTADARLTLYEGTAQGELYDLKNDPLELNNLFDEPAHRPLRLEMTEKLLREMLAHRDLSRYPAS
ncbi:MAG: sulfatase-like hydrolase/transferase [Ardenticatenaceae bacterium]|nr:sulfatase-like hydrolase/transferase [Ardenticatenaceae bacterium]